MCSGKRFVLISMACKNAKLLFIWIFHCANKAEKFTPPYIKALTRHKGNGRGKEKWKQQPCKTPFDASYEKNRCCLFFILLSFPWQFNIAAQRLKRETATFKYKIIHNYKISVCITVQNTLAKPNTFTTAYPNQHSYAHRLNTPRIVVTHAHNFDSTTPTTIIHYFNIFFFLVFIVLVVTLICMIFFLTV